MALDAHSDVFKMCNTVQNSTEKLSQHADRLFEQGLDEFIVPEGMPTAIWESKYARKVFDENGSVIRYQTWAERLREVVIGNFSLGNYDVDLDDFEDAMRLSVSGAMSYAGRHLQHGDLNQRDKNLELYSNCTTSIFSFVTFWMLLNGAGVGSDYSTYTRRVNWDYMPQVRLVLNGGNYDSGAVELGAHKDFDAARNEFIGAFDSLREAQHKYPAESENVRWFNVEDSREGWVKVIEILETAAFHKVHKDKLYIFVFDKIRPAGEPIKGQQNRPASGPLPLMRAILRMCSIRGAGMPEWKQAMFVDDALASCVALGGVRRSARMATKWWRDKDINEFVKIKRGGHLRTSNNSILVDKEFWEECKNVCSDAYLIFHAATAAAYHDGTGEPGFINVDMLNCDTTGIESITKHNWINPNSKLQIHDRTRDMMGNVLEALKKQPAHRLFIVNPCSEIALSIYGAYCVIGDVNLAAVKSLNDARRAAALMAQMLVRTNTMNALYSAEVSRTNRIGVGLIGIFEFAWKFFKLDFDALISAEEDFYPAKINNQTCDLLSSGSSKENRVKAFWAFIDELRVVAEEAAERYSYKIAMTVPHTVTTIKPSGTVAKVMATTEGANLPALSWYLRWVQFPKIDPATGEFNAEVQDFIDRGYPTRDVSHAYTNAIVVGFPTKSSVNDTIMAEGGKPRTAAEISPAKHYRWLQLIERHWFGVNVDQNGNKSSRNNQCSYTLKFLKDEVTMENFAATVLEYQPTIRCCSFDITQDIGKLISAYPYVPEEPISKSHFDELVEGINRRKKEAYDPATLECVGGVCPIEVDIN